MDLHGGRVTFRDFAKREDLRLTLDKSDSAIVAQASRM
jgi:hypothetical protein